MVTATGIVIGIASYPLIKNYLEIGKELTVDSVFLSKKLYKAIGGS